MNEKDIICQYAKELKLATVREILSLFVEDAVGISHVPAQAV